MIYCNTTQLTRLDNSYIISLTSFKDQKPFILIEIPFCDRNENKSKDVIQKFHVFANKKLKIPLE